MYFLSILDIFTWNHWLEVDRLTLHWLIFPISDQILDDTGMKGNEPEKLRAQQASVPNDIMKMYTCEWSIGRKWIIEKTKLHSMNNLILFSSSENHFLFGFDACTEESTEEGTEKDHIRFLQCFLPFIVADNSLRNLFDVSSPHNIYEYMTNCWVRCSLRQKLFHFVFFSVNDRKCHQTKKYSIAHMCHWNQPIARPGLNLLHVQIFEFTDVQRSQFGTLICSLKNDVSLVGWRISIYREYSMKYI